MVEVQQAAANRSSFYGLIIAYCLKETGYAEEEKMKRTQHGFTLIELMIVVAIIGILAAISSSYYIDYVARSQATEALKATAGLQADIAVYAAENKALPSGDADIDAAAAALTGKYFSTGGTTIVAGAINVAFDSGVHAGQTFVLTPMLNASTGQITRWTCSGLAANSFLPRGCR